MFKKKRTNIYDSYEDDIQDIASKEAELLNSYNENDDEYYEIDSDNENLDIDNIEDYEVIEVDDSEKEEKEPEVNNDVDNDINIDNNTTDYESENYEEYSKEDEEYLEESPKKRNSSKLVHFLNILFVIIIIALLMITTDIICISKYNIGPFFAIPTHTYKDGGTKEYYGLGYKVIKYHQVQGRKDTEIGLWSLKYNIEPTTVKSLDLAIEFYNDEAKTYKKYYKKFVRVVSTLEKVDEKNNTITLSYIDEGKKYSLDIQCDMASKNSNIDKLEKGKEVTIIGTVNKYDFKSSKRVGKLYINNCFAEQ